MWPPWHTADEDSESPSFLYHYCLVLESGRVKIDGTIELNYEIRSSDDHDRFCRELRDGLVEQDYLTEDAKFLIESLSLLHDPTTS